MAIGNKLVFDVNGNVEDFVFILSTKDYRHLGAIQNVIPESVHHAGNLASVNEISFEVYKTVEKEVNEEVIEVEEPLWNELTNLKLIYVRELDEYYETNVQLDDTTEVIKKTITCKSLCEAELGQIYIHGLEANTETDIARNDYEPTVFYNKSNPSASLLHRVFSFAPHYTIKHVDESLINLQRTFSVDNTAMYDWIISDCANEFKCLFMFDSTNRGVYVYDLCTVCKDCGHRAEYIDKCPECGSTNLEYFGDDTTIYVDKENLTDSIQFTTDVDSIKNCFKLVAGDNIITSTVRMLNMNGTDFIYKPTEEQLMEMPLELRNKIVSYDKLYFSYKDEYEKIVSDIYEATNKINYYTHTMMPTIEQSEITVQSEADKLTAINLSPLGLSSVTTSTSQATVESALKNYAKVYVKTGYVKIEINSSNYKYVGTDSSGWNYGTWTGNFKVTNYSDSEDIAYSEIISVKVYDNYQDFIEQKILKNVANNSDEEDSVFDVLFIDELSDFKQALKLYCLNRLTSFYDAIQSALDVLIEVDQASESADLYEPLYMPYYDKLQACQNEIDSRQATIDEWQNTYDNLVLRQQEIQADLNFQDYLGEELYKIFCMYKREDTYQNDNYISDGLSDSEIIQKAKDFLEVAQKELEKARTPNHSISSTLHNLLIMPEFKPIIDNFKLGNWLRICVDGIVYRLRLIGYELSFSSIQTLSVEFSNITKLNTIANETKNILDSAKSMASNFDYFVAQAKRGNEANVEITHWLEDGLQSALVNIKNNNNEEITFDKHGLWAKTYNSETGNYDPEMFRLTHNILAYTTDGFKTVKAALGKHNYYKFDESGKLVQDIAYGIRCDFVAAGYIYGSQIISGDIYSENYSSTTGSHINLKTGAFTLGSGKIVYNPTTNKMEVKGVNIEWSSSTTPEISDIDGLSNYLDQLDGRIQTYSQATDPSKGWTTTEKSEHIGDLWFDTTNSLTKRWNGSSWDIITDSELKELAQSKAQIFTTTPTIPYYVGDLWVQGSSGDIMNCIKTRTSGSYTASDWVKSSKYTDDSALQNFINGDYADDLEGIAKQIDERAQTWYLTKAQMDDEVATWTDKSIHVGDLWYRTDASTSDNQTFMYNSSYAWEVINGVPKEIFDMADGKCSLYVSKPSNYKAKDIWILDIENSSGTNSTYPKYEKGTLLVSLKDNSSYSVSDWSEIVKYSNKLQDFINNTYASALANIQGQIDAKADSYYQSTAPHLEYTKVANNETYNNYVGDLWFNTSDNKSYTYVKVSNSSDSTKYDYKWVETNGVPDDVYDLIDGKATIYVSKPSAYNIGDLLIPTNTFTVSSVTFTKGKVYKATKTATTFAASDWVEISYTDDTSLNAFIEGDYAHALDNINKQIDGKARAWYQSDDPSLTWDKNENHEGDLWYDTDANSQVTSIYHNNAWKATSVPKSLFDTIDGIASIYVTMPSKPQVGDLLIPTANIGTTYKAGKAYKYNGTSWVEIAYTDDTKANEALEAANKAQLSADNAKSVAENAETIGNNLVNVLGYDGTKITGTYIYSPVISGGTILVGDKNGTYAEITTEGVLNCVGANVSGTFYSSSGSIAGWKITSSKLQKEDTSSGLYVALCSPTEVGGFGNSNADVLVVRTGTSSNGYQYPVVLSSNGDIVANSLKSSNAQITGGSFKIKTTADTTSYISLNGKYSGTEFFAGGMKHTTGNTELTVGVTADGGEPFVQVRENYAYDNTICSEGIYINKITSTTSTNIVSINARGVYTDSDLFAGGDLAVLGKKSRIATTDDYGMRSLYCYETPTPTFGDIGEGQIDDTGKCYIFLDDIFAETIDTKCTYQVFLQTYGKGECYVTERTSSYFIVEGTENLSFGWEVKAVQKEYDTMRLEEYEGDKQDEDTSSILNDTYNYLDSLLYDVESEEF